MHIMTAVKLWFIPICVFFFSAACGAAENDTQRVMAAVVETALQPVIQEHNIPGLAVAVTLNGKRYHFNYGVSAKETLQPVTKDTLFEIGSVSKTFTATLAAYAQVSGAISLSNSASKYFPPLRGSCLDDISLLDLGTYTAGGLPLQFSDEVDDEEKMIGYFKNWKPSFAAGTHRRYSNPSIGLFGFLAARSMGMSFDDLMEKGILVKLGLTRTYIKVPKDQMKQYAQGYTKADKPVRVNPGVLDSEAYGIKSNAADMLQFVEANMKGLGLEESMQRAITATHTGYFKVGNMTQGLGWEIYPYPIALNDLLAGNSSQISAESNEVARLTPPLLSQDNALFNKTGSTNGFGAYVAFVPAKRLGIVILANKNYPIAARVKAAHQILAAIDAQISVESNAPVPLPQ